MESFDLIVVGAGSAGFAAARTAATTFGARVALVDRGPLGGLCILAGCMPSKALIQASHVAHMVANARAFGIEVAGWKVDFPAVMARKDRLIRGYAEDRAAAIAGLPNTELVLGEPAFTGPTALRVGDRELSAPRFVLAVGSKPAVPPVPGLREAGFLVSDQVLDLDALPESLAIIGGGTIALELGQFFARLGTRVTIVEAAPRLLAREDPDVSAALHRCLAAEGIEVRTGVKPFRVERRGDQKAVCFEGPGGGTADVVATELLVATGREPAVAGLALDVAGVRMEGRRMLLDRCLRTTNPAIFAAGDVTGTTFMVHVAVADGELAARNALLGCAPTPAPEHLFISAAFTEPNLARVGMSEQEARQLGREVVVGRYAFADHGKAEIRGETDGFVKVLADPRTGEILGATIVGPDGAELIHELAAAIALRATVERFLAVPHVHPTLAEILTYPAEDILRQIRTRARTVSTFAPGGYSDEAESWALESLERPSADRGVT